MKNHHHIILSASNPLIVELDSEAHAAYVRFSKKKVVRTLPITTDGCIVTVDFDSADEVVGIELVGVDEFGIKPLLKKTGLEQRIPKHLMENARYIPANLVAA
jgi:uncharacterized protein YuzE